MTVGEALKARISVRKFLDKPVDLDLLRQVLDTARWAPSGGNMQPWKVIVVTGSARDAVIEIGKSESQAAYMDASLRQDGEFPVYPENLREPYRSRRSQVGRDMYEAMGVAREDRDARIAHVMRNYEFFGAPVGVFFVIDRQMGRGQWAHLGMFMQSFCLAATEVGLGTCMQEAWSFSRKSLAQHFGLPENELVYCGMSLGWPDMADAVNNFRSARMDIDDFTEFRGV